MSTFVDSAAAEETQRRLESLTGIDLAPLLADSFAGNPEPDTALTNLERWLLATGNPRLYLEQVAGNPRRSRELVYLLGASQPLADSLIQNPELATMLLDASVSPELSKRDQIVAEGARLLSSAAGLSHALDRLRYLKQRHSLPIVAHDLAGSWTQESVWLALSELADALIELALTTVWANFAEGKGLPKDPPLAVVAFGKLGARELNYSSDIDLVYVVRDGLDEGTERECVRFCEMLGRGLSDRMGRGSLYRVDLRLRPYGAAGPILRSIGSYEGYYRLYAEAWEIQALLKSRVVAGADLADRWQGLITERVFQPQVSDASLAEMLRTRRRIEEHASSNDVKRGSGGIRDVEFLCQILQLVHGHRLPAVRAPGTCDALRALGEEHVLEPYMANALIDSYTFLRRLEHRLQLVGNLQTHSIPTSQPAREKLARLMGLENWSDLDAAIEFHRRTIQSLYRSILRQEPDQRGERELLAAKLGDLAPGLWQWFDVLPESDAFYRSLVENEGSLDRARSILKDAPKLIASFKGSLQLTELLLSGEIEEQPEPSSRIDALPVDAAPKRVAETCLQAEVISCARWAMGHPVELETELGQIRDSLMRHCLRRLQADFDVVALGSYGSGEVGPGSDVDLLLLTDRNQPVAELAAQDFLALLGQLQRYGLAFKPDLRLRPDGGKGLLVRTYEGFGAYELSAMEMWERFALGHARLVFGDSRAFDLAIHAAYVLPLTPERLRELVRMKRRIETERVQPQHIKRNVKLGAGGLNDIEWIVHLNEMRYPTATHAGKSSHMEVRIRNLGRASLLNALEVESLLNARSHLLGLRTRIHLLDFPADLLPENPDRLDRLAEASGEPNGNELLRHHQPIVEWVRSLFDQTLERLRA